MPAITALQKQLRHALADCPPDDIYNSDETGFFHKLGHSSTLASGLATRKKRSKGRVAITVKVTKVEELGTAWNAGGPSTVVNCWHHAGIPPAEDGDHSDGPNDYPPFARLQRCL